MYRVIVCLVRYDFLPYTLGGLSQPPVYAQALRVGDTAASRVLSLIVSHLQRCETFAPWEGAPIGAGRTRSNPFYFTFLAPLDVDRRRFFFV